MLPKAKEKGPIIIMLVIIWLLLAVFGCHLAKAQATAKKSDSGMEIALEAMGQMQKNPFNIFPLNSHTLPNVGVMTLVGVVAAALILVEMERNKVDAPLSAKWNTADKKYQKKYVTPYTQKEREAGKVDNNTLLAEGLGLSMDTRLTRRNLNMLVVGGSGSGKSRFIVKPNLLQMNASFICTDPSGELFRSCGRALLDAGYDLKLFSISDMVHSNVYNPFDYVYDAGGNIDENKVAVMVSTFIKNAGDMQKKSGGDQFWVKSATALIMAISMYLLEFRSKNERNFTNVLALVQAGRVNENDSSSATGLDHIFDKAKMINKNARCFSSYETFKLAGAKTAASILVSAAVDLNMFGMDKVRNLTQSDLLDEGTKDERLSDRNLNLHTLGDKKTVLFINIPQADGTYRFLVSMVYSQLFTELYDRAAQKCPECWHIIGSDGRAVSSMYPTQETAQMILEKYAQAQVRETKRIVKNTGIEAVDYEVWCEDADIFEKYKGRRKGITRKWDNDARIFYVIEKDGKDEKIIDAGTKDGVLRTFQTREGAESFIRQAQGAKVAHGDERLPVHVRAMLDEFANIGEIPNFSEYVATMRKYEISCTIILQSNVQLDAKYDKEAKVIIGNCDTFIFLGATELETCKYIQERMGKTKAIQRSNGRSRSGKGENTSLNFQKQDIDLLPVSEIAKLDNEKCIVMLRGESPFYISKVKYEKCPNYKLTGDADKSRELLKDFLDMYFLCPDKTGEVKKRGKEIESQGRKIDAAHRNEAPDHYPRGQKKKLLDDAKEITDTASLMAAAGAQTPAELSDKIKSDNNTAKPARKKAKVRHVEQEFEFEPPTPKKAGSTSSLPF